MASASVSSFRIKIVGLFSGGPKAALTVVGNCPGKSSATSSSFTLSPTGELKAGTGLCLVARPLFGAQLWSKPLPNGKVAVLVVNLAPETQFFSLPLADVPALVCGGSCTVRDVWAQTDLAPKKDHLQMTLREHESGYFILGPAKCD